MPIHITVDQAATLGAERWINYQHPGISQDRKERLLPVTKYNLLATGFNAATVLLVAAVANAALFAFSTAFTLGAIGLFIRLMTEREINRYAAPQEPTMKQMFTRSLGIQDKHEREVDICLKLGMAQPQGWDENEVFLFDFAVWKNTLPHPR